MPILAALLGCFVFSLLSVIAVYCGNGADNGVKWHDDVNNWAFGCDFKGNDLASLGKIPSKDCGPTCAATILATDRCTHFSWTELDGGTCRLKKGPVSKEDAIHSDNPSAVCGIVPFVKQPTSPIVWNEKENWAYGCDFPDNDLKSIITASSNLCGPICGASPGCTHFTWTSYNGGTCWLKKGIVWRKNAVPVGERSTLCGIVVESKTSAIVWKDGHWAERCDFLGNDFTNTLSRRDTCSDKCMASDRCTHYTWNSYRGGTCWMKTGPVDTKNAFFTDDASMICGMARPRLMIPPPHPSPPATPQITSTTTTDASTTPSTTTTMTPTTTTVTTTTIPETTTTTTSTTTLTISPTTTTTSEPTTTINFAPIVIGTPKIPIAEVVIGTVYDYELRDKAHLTEMQLEQELKAIRQHFLYVRTRQASWGHQLPFARIAAKYSAKLFIGVDMYKEAEVENKALVSLIKSFPNSVEAVIVGDNNLAPNGPFSVDDIIARINEVRREIGTATNSNNYKKIPVGTAQPLLEWLVDSAYDSDMVRLAHNCDIIGVNFYPFSSVDFIDDDGQQHQQGDAGPERAIELAWTRLTHRYDPNKIRLTATSYPTDGGQSLSGAAVAGLQPAIKFYQALLRWRPKPSARTQSGVLPIFWDGFYDRSPDDALSFNSKYDGHCGFFTFNGSRKSFAFPPLA